MQAEQPDPLLETEAEYRKIEAALIETARGRWFLAEHSRRSRRLETEQLEGSLERLRSALRVPPALLGRLRLELGQVEAAIAEARAEMLVRETQLPPTPPGLAPLAGSTDELTALALLDATERLHELVWSLQGDPGDGAVAGEIGRRTLDILGLAARQAHETRRAARFVAALDAISAKVEATRECLALEDQVVAGEPPRPEAPGHDGSDEYET